MCRLLVTVTVLVFLSSVALFLVYRRFWTPVATIRAVDPPDPMLVEEHSPAMKTSRRWKRQTVPVDNIQVYAINSNVSVTDQIQVLSAESRIHVLEPLFNATIWSNTSLIRFDLEATEASGGEKEVIGLSASNSIALYIHLNGVELEGTGDTLQFNSSTNRSGSNSNDEDTSFLVQLAGGGVNFSVADNQLISKLRAIDGNLAFVTGQSWKNASVKPHLSVVSALNKDSQKRELSIASRSQRYELQVRLEGNKLELFFAGLRANISDDHKVVSLRTKDGHFKIQIQTSGSPFEVFVEDDVLRVNCFEENTILEVPTTIEKSPLILSAGQLTRLYANRSSASGNVPRLSVNGGSSIMVDNMELIARQLKLYLNTDQTTGFGTSSILVDSSHSQLKLHHSNQTVSTTKAPMITAMFTAVRHILEIMGGEPLLLVQTGNISFTIHSIENETVTAEPMWNIVDTSILPHELLGVHEGEDYLRIGPFAPGLNDLALNKTPGWMSLDEWSKIVGQHSGSKSTLAPVISGGVFTPRMIEADKLLTFHQTLLPSTTTMTPQSSTEGVYPTPSESIFTFAPTVSVAEEKVLEIRPTGSMQNLTGNNETDFVVAHFDTTTKKGETSESSPQPETTTSIFTATTEETSTVEAPSTTAFHHPFPYLVSTTSMQPPNASNISEPVTFPISATIISIELPANATLASIEEEFKGIDRENRVEWPTTIEPSTSTRNRREILSPLVEKREQKEGKVIELDIKMDPYGKNSGGENESTFVRLKFGLERSINQILNGIFNEDEKALPEGTKLVRLTRNRRQSEVATVNDERQISNLTGNSPIHIQIREVRKISPSESPEEVYRVRFVAETDNEDTVENSNLSDFIVQELNRLGVEELSRKLNLKVLSYLRIQQEKSDESSESSLIENLGLGWSTVSRIFGGLIFVLGSIALVWALLALKNRSRIWSLTVML